MSHSVQTVGADENIRVAAELMRIHVLGALPVISAERLVGILTDRDIAIRLVASDRNVLTTWSATS